MPLTTQDLSQINTIVTNIVTNVVTNAVSGLATKDELTSTQAALKDELKADFRAELKKIRTMLEEDYGAESHRVTRIDRRLHKVETTLKAHLAQ
jgi:hypothetical protein